MLSAPLPDWLFEPRSTNSPISKSPSTHKRHFSSLNLNPPHSHTKPTHESTPLPSLKISNASVRLPPPPPLRSRSFPPRPQHHSPPRCRLSLQNCPLTPSPPKRRARDIRAAAESEHRRLQHTQSLLHPLQPHTLGTHHRARAEGADQPVACFGFRVRGDDQGRGGGRGRGAASESEARRAAGV